MPVPILFDIFLLLWFSFSFSMAAYLLSECQHFTVPPTFYYTISANYHLLSTTHDLLFVIYRIFSTIYYLHFYFLLAIFHHVLQSTVQCILHTLHLYNVCTCMLFLQVYNLSNIYNILNRIYCLNIYYSIEELLVSAEDNSNYVIGVLNLKAIPVI